MKLNYQKQKDFIYSFSKFDDSPFSYTEFIIKYLDDSIQLQEDAMKFHIDNNKYFSDNYKTLFDHLMYESICDEHFVKDIAYCENIYYSILNSGLYIVNIRMTIRYKDIVERIFSGYFQILDHNVLSFLINDETFIMAELIMKKYQIPNLKLLLSHLNDSSYSMFNFLIGLSITFTATGLLLIFVAYLILWRIYLDHIRMEIFISKSELCHLPIDIIIKTNDLTNCLFRIFKEIINNSEKKPITLIG